MATIPYQLFFSYFGLRENPFHVSPDARFYHPTPAQDSAVKELQYGLQTRQGLLVLTGDAGTGKTTLLNAILESLEQRRISTAYIFHPLLEPVELFEFILRDFGVKCESHRKGDLLHSLHEWLISRNATGDSPVVIIDEAQLLSSQTLDELRLLLNLETARGKLLQIILVGQSELQEKLRRPELQQLRQRVMIHCRLPLFSKEQTVGYIRSRVSRAGLPSTELFPRETLHLIHEHARGIPRLINLLCEHALITAYGEQQKIISPDIVQRIAVDFELPAEPIPVENDYSADSLGRLITLPLAETPQRDASPPVEDERVRVQGKINSAVHDAAAQGIPEDVVPELTPVPPMDHQGFWRHRTSRSRLPKSIRRASAAFVEYGRQVGDSFIHDFRHFIRPLTLATHEQTLSLNIEASSPPWRRISLPIANWLRHRITSGRISDKSHSNRSASSK